LSIAGRLQHPDLPPVDPDVFRQEIRVQPHRHRHAHERNGSANEEEAAGARAARRHLVKL